MYNVNDTVLYGKQGVCVIKDIVRENFSGKPLDYYYLKPAYNESTVIYVPVENKELVGKMKKVLSSDEINDLIKDVKKRKPIWYDNEKERKEKFNAIITGGDRKEILQLINALYINKQEREAMGKKMYAGDEKLMREAEKLIYEEFATVLNIKPDKVVDYIVKKFEEV